MGKEKILILGSRGLLGTSFRESIRRNNITDIDFIYGVRTEKDVETKDDIVFDILKVNEYGFILDDIDVIINCTAYTDVDKAETDEMNYKINATAVDDLAKACKKHNVYLIQFSTDFVFSGFKRVRNFNPEDLKYPANHYGKAKALGEVAVEDSGCDYLMFRISWLYSELKPNFITKIYDKLSKNEDVIAINDIVSGLTYADDLVKEILVMIINRKIYEEDVKNRFYHYRNEGDVSVYEVAEFINEYCNSKAKVTPISREEFDFKAKRSPHTSLSIDRFKKTFNSKIPSWQTSLKRCLDNYQKLV